MNNDVIDYDRYGPWNDRLTEYVTSKPIVLLIHNLTNEDSIEREFKLDYGNKEDRKFIGRVSFWALTHNRSVEIIAAEEWVKMNG